MIELDELKELLKDPEFKFMIRSTVIDAINQPKTNPKDDLDKMIVRLKGTGFSIKNIPELTESVIFINLILNNKEVLGDLILDLDTNHIENYFKEMATLISELEN